MKSYKLLRRPIGSDIKETELEIVGEDNDNIYLKIKGDKRIENRSLRWY